jgi:quercetin dioxygenase-like cupin family protein
VIIGSRGEATRFHLRYFEIASEGRTSCERHEHAHVVIGVRGAGTVRVGRRTMKLFPLDVCYIGPWEVHQLVNRDPEPFGFFCIVDAERDPAVPVLKHPLVVPAGATTITRRKRTPQTKAVRPLRRRTR